MIDIKMPSLGADMEKGTIVAWHIQPGSVVQKGDIIVDVETDKGTIAVDVWESGRVADLLIQPGTTVPIGTTIAHLEGVSPTEKSPQKLEPQEIPSKPRETTEVVTTITHETQDIHKHQRVSPLARRLAQDLSIDLSLIPDHSDGSPITKKDVEAYAESHLAKDISQETKPLPPPSSGISQEQSERLRTVISALMSRSQREIPHYFVESEINLASTMSWLDKVNTGRGIQKRLLPIVPLIKAVALAAQRVKGINGFYDADRYHPQDEIRLGMVLSLRTGGIVNPALTAPDKMSLDDIMSALMDLIQRARHGKLKSSEVTGQTLTITSLGDLGADRVMGKIYPPQVALVGIGRIRSRPWANGSMIGAVPTVHVTLAGDHRASDGLSGANFLGALDLLLQHPDKLL